MPIEGVFKRIGNNLEKFESKLQRFEKQVSLLAKTGIKSEIVLFKRIEKERAVIQLLRNDILHKKRYSDANIEGIHHLESEIVKRLSRLSSDEAKFFFGNSFVKSALGFEKDLLGKTGVLAKELHDISTGVQLQIRDLLDFAGEHIKGAQLDKAGLYRKSLQLADMNLNLFQQFIYLSSMKFDSSSSLEEYHHEKSILLNQAKNWMELDHGSLSDNLQAISSFYSSDIQRTNSI